MEDHAVDVPTAHGGGHQERRCGQRGVVLLADGKAREASRGQSSTMAK